MPRKQPGARFGGKAVVNKMAATDLYEAREIEPWKESFQLYEKILKVKAKREKKEKAEKLLELDNWQVNSNVLIYLRRERFGMCS